MIRILEDHALAYKEYLTFDAFKFSGGEIQVRITSPLRMSIKPLKIEAKLWSSDDFFELALLVDAIRRQYPDVSIGLVCPYLPYARQDRVCADGEALSLKVFCTLINSLKFKYVEIWDVHSDVAKALLDNVKVVPQYLIFNSLTTSLDYNTIVVSPDAGAVKKCLEISKNFGFEVIYAEKIRDPKTGNISGTKVHATSEDINGRDIIVVDDICDGGRTFIELAKVLRPLTNGKIMLYVTHGIFSKGLNALYDFDKIFVANLHPSVKVEEQVRGWVVTR